MENFLDIDINEIVNKEIADKISQQDDIISKLREKIGKLNAEIESLKYENKTIKKDSDTLIEIINALRNNQSLDVDYFLSSLIGLKPTLNLSYDTHYDYEYFILVKYYNDKDFVIKFLNFLGHKVSFEKAHFKLGRDYTKEELISKLYCPAFLTNGCMLNYSWATFPDQIPYSEYFINPLIIDLDVFNTILDTIKNKRGEWQILLNIPKYTNLTNIQINQIFDAIDFQNCDSRNKKNIIYCIRSFVNKLSIDNQIKVLEKQDKIYRDDCDGISYTHFSDKALCHFVLKKTVKEIMSYQLPNEITMNLLLSSKTKEELEQYYNEKK